MLAGKMLLQRLLQLGFSLLFLMAPSCDSRLLPLPGARGCSAGSAAAAGCGWGGQGLRSGTAVLGGDPTHPWGRAHGWGWQRLQEPYWAQQQLLLEAAPAVPHDPSSPGALGLWGPLRPFPASGVLAAVEHLLPGALPPCFGAAGSSSHRLPRACPLLSGWTEP